VPFLSALEVVYDSALYKSTITLLYFTTVVHNTVQNSTVPIIFPLNLQTIITAQTQSNRRKTKQNDKSDN